MGSIFTSIGGRNPGRVTTYNFGGGGYYDGENDRYDIPGGNIQDNLNMFSDLQKNSDALAGAINQAQAADAAGENQGYMQFIDNVVYAVQNPAELTQEDYDKFSSEIGDIQRALLNPEQKKAAISQVLTNAGIYHDVASLDILGKGSDSGGLLSKRIKIVPPDSSGGGGDSAADDAAEVITAPTQTDAGAAVLSAAGVGGLDDVVSGNIFNGTWQYNQGTDSFDYNYYDNDGNFISTDSSIPKSQVAGAADKAFGDGENVGVAFNPDQKPFLEHGGKTEQESNFDIAMGIYNTGGVTGILEALEKAGMTVEDLAKATGTNALDIQEVIAAAGAVAGGAVAGGAAGGAGAVAGGTGGTGGTGNATCGPGTKLAGQLIPADGNCNPKDKPLDPGTETCEAGTKLAGQPKPADGNCNPEDKILDPGKDPGTGIGGGVGPGTGTGIGPGSGSGSGGGEGNSDLLTQLAQKTPFSTDTEINIDRLTRYRTPLLERLFTI